MSQVIDIFSRPTISALRVSEKLTVFSIQKNCFFGLMFGWYEKSWNI